MVSVANAFTAEQLEGIERLGDERAAGNATIEGAQADAPVAKLRVTQVAWIDQNPGSQWLYDRMNAVVGDLNARANLNPLKAYFIAYTLKMVSLVIRLALPSAQPFAEFSQASFLILSCN